MKAKPRRRGRAAMPAPPKGLTPREYQLLVLVARSIDKTGVQPSYRQLAQRLGYTSLNFISQMVKNLVRKREVTQCGARGLSYNWRAYLPDQTNNSEEEQHGS